MGPGPMPAPGFASAPGGRDRGAPSGAPGNARPATTDKRTPTATKPHEPPELLGGRQRGTRPLPAARPPRQQPRRRLLRRHRRRDQPALHRVTPEIPQPLPRLVVLDTL